MKVKYSIGPRPGIVLMGFLLLMPVEVKAQYEWLLSTNEGDDISVELIGYSGTGGYVDIPATYNGYPVTDIGNSAFLNQSNITSVTMPNSVVIIDDGAFGSCSALTSVTFGSSVTSIGVGAFGSC